MGKKSLILFFSLFFINSVSAYYGQSSLENLLNELDPSTAILGSMFIIFFIMSNYALARAFKGQKGISGILAFVISFLAIYTINRSGFDYQNIYYNLFSGIGLPSEVASTFLPVILFAAAILIILKYNFGVLLIITGIFIFGYGFGFAYEKGLTMVVGAVIAIIGFWINNKKKHSEISLGKKPFFGGASINPNWKQNLKSGLKWTPEKMKDAAKWYKEKKERENSKIYIENLESSWKAIRPAFIILGESKAPNFKSAYLEYIERYRYDPNKHSKNPDVERVLRNIQEDINKIFRIYR